jgi:hypothetical protein
VEDRGGKASPHSRPEGVSVSSIEKARKVEPDSAKSRSNAAQSLARPEKAAKAKGNNEKPPSETTTVDRKPKRKLEAEPEKKKKKKKKKGGDIDDLFSGLF